MHSLNIIFLLHKSNVTTIYTLETEIALMELITKIIEIFLDDTPTFSKEFNIESIRP
jgi:hypothetical protein